MSKRTAASRVTGALALAALATIGMAPGAMAQSQEWGDGTHRVGSQLSPGQYRITPVGAGCTWSQLADSSGSASAILTEDAITRPTTVTVRSDAAFVQLTGCTMSTFSTTAPTTTTRAAEPPKGQEPRKAVVASGEGDEQPGAGVLLGAGGALVAAGAATVLVARRGASQRG